MLCFVSDNSSFAEVQKQVEGGFRLFNQFTVFAYSQLQSILPDSILGNISNWDGFLHLDLDSTALPYKSPDEFILNEDFHRLVIASKLPRPSKFVEQSISFCKAFCRQLLAHDFVQSNLLRGLSAFDPAVIFENSEEHYVTAIDKLTSHFVSAGLFSSSDKVKAVSQYRSLVTKLRVGSVPEYSDWIHFMSSYYELQCRPELFRLFKHSCLCLAPIVELPSPFIVPIPNLESDKDVFQSCIRSLQISYQTVPHVSSLFRDPKAVGRVFRLLGRGVDLIGDKKFSVWNFLKGSGSRRSVLLGKMETNYRKAVLRHDKPSVSSSGTTPSVSRTSSVGSSPSPDPSLSRASIPLNRCSSGAEQAVPKKASAKAPKSKKN